MSGKGVSWNLTGFRGSRPFYTAALDSCHALCYNDQGILEKWKVLDEKGLKRGRR